MIRENSETNSEITVAINTWDRGDTSNKRIPGGRSQEWNRSDKRGFVMTVSKGGSTDNYYVLFDSRVSVFEKEVTRNNKKIPPLNEVALA